jgi:hypothetical protein
MQAEPGQYDARKSAVLATIIVVATVVGIVVIVLLLSDLSHDRHGSS